MRYLLVGFTFAIILNFFIAPLLNMSTAQEVHEHADHAATADGPFVTDENLEVDPVAEGLTLPTTMAFLDQDSILVLEKDNGTVRMVEDGQLRPEPLLDVAVANDNERGMLGIAISSNETKTYVFLYFTESGGGVDGDDKQGIDPAGNRLYRYELQDYRLVNATLLLDLPALPGPRYNGGPVIVGPDDNVYVVIGDVEGHTTQAQNFENGSAADGTSGILRVGQDGQVPESIIGTGVFGKYYYAYGIRNSFGMDFDPASGHLWDTENGPAFGDEINLVPAGFNSGWRDVMGIASPQNITDLVLFNSGTQYSDPEFTWRETIGPTALEFLNSTVLGRSYQDDIFVGDINNGALYRFELNENRSALVLEGSLADTIADSSNESEQVTFGKGFGGITDIETGPDGYLYVLSFTEGALFRIAPADETPTVAATAELTVKSTDLSGAEITGMYVTIRSEHGELEETGYTPLTFAGVIGSEYVMTAADFENRKFEHWENGDSAREKSITLERDTAVTAVYRITQVNDSAVDLGTNSLDNVITLLANTDCIDDNEEKKIAKSLEKIIKQLIGRDDRTIGKLEKTLSGIAESCLEDEDDDNGSRHGLGKGHKDDNSGRGSDDEDDD